MVRIPMSGYWSDTHREEYLKLQRERQRELRASRTSEERSRLADIPKHRKYKVNRPKPECCEVCGIKAPLKLDHCHTRKLFRGWLCNGCNAALGFVKDDPATLRKLAEYLEQSLVS